MSARTTDNSGASALNQDYSLLASDVTSASSYNAFDGIRGPRQLLLTEQDRTLDDLSRTAARMNQTALVINEELQDQERLLANLDNDVDRETEHMHRVLRGMARILKTSSRKELCLILWLSGLAFVLLFLLLL